MDPRGRPKITQKQRLVLSLLEFDGNASNEKTRIARARKILLGCKDCGYSKFAEALQFDHRPDEVKVHNVAGWPYDVASMLVEMDKCDVVCANCHAVRTALRRTQPHLVRLPSTYYFNHQELLDRSND